MRSQSVDVNPLSPGAIRPNLECHVRTKWALSQHFPTHPQPRLTLDMYSFHSQPRRPYSPAIAYVEIRQFMHIDSSAAPYDAPHENELPIEKCTSSILERPKLFTCSESESLSKQIVSCVRLLCGCVPVLRCAYAFQDQA